MQLKAFFCAAFTTLSTTVVIAQTPGTTPVVSATTPVPDAGFPATPTPKPSPTPLTPEALEQHFLPRELSADSPSVMALEYNGYRRSQIGPCGCVSKQLGSIDKEAQILEVLQKRNVPTVAVDAGGYLKDVFTDFDLQRTKGALKVMGLLGYDAVNVGYTDLGAGVKALQDTAREANVPLVSANIVDADGKPVFEPYRVETLKLRSGEDVRVGFLGVTRPRNTAGMAPRPKWTPTPASGAAPQTTPTAAVRPEAGTFAESQKALGSETGAAAGAADAYTVGDPVEAIKKYVPELKEKSDIIVLLSYAKRNMVEQQLKEAADVAEAIDIAVSGEYGAAQTAVQNVGSTRLVSGGYEGRQAGLLLLDVTQGDIKNQAFKWIEIEQSIPSVPKIKAIVDETKDATVGQVGGAAGH